MSENYRRPHSSSTVADVFARIEGMPDYAGLGAEFRERYRRATDPAMVRAERSVIGGDYGAASYTTMEQADHLAVRLQLEPGRLLLDIGSGSGWPGTRV